MPQRIGLACSTPMRQSLVIGLTTFVLSGYAQAQVAEGIAGKPAIASSGAAAHSAPTIIGSAVPSLGFGAILQAVFGLLIVIGIVFACGWLARRLGFQPSRQSGLIKVVGAASLGARERVVVVEVADTWLVLGVGTGSVRRLHTLPAQHPDTPDSGNTSATPPSFQAAFAQQLRARFSTKGKD